MPFIAPTPTIAAAAGSIAGAVAPHAGTLALINAGVQTYGQVRDASMRRSLDEYNIGLAERNATYQAEVDAAFYQNQAEWGQYNADVLQSNARAELQAAKGAKEAGKENARRRRIGNRDILSSMEAQYGASGVVVSSGAPLAVLAESASRLELGAIEEFRQGEREAYTHQVNAIGLQNQAAGAEHGAGVSLMRGEVAEYGSILAGQDASAARESSRQTYRSGMLGAGMTAIAGVASYGITQNYFNRVGVGGASSSSSPYQYTPIIRPQPYR